SALCQEAGIVPIVEPEVLMDGEHDLEVCYDITEATLRSLFGSLYEHNVMLEGTILKASMVISGKSCPEQASAEEVAEATVRCLKAAVPAALPGIVFLSGGQSDEQATAHLNAMNQIGPHPWPLSFSYGRAMQQAALKLWAKDMQANFAEAQKIVSLRAKENGPAALGQWQKAAWKFRSRVEPKRALRGALFFFGTTFDADQGGWQVVEPIRRYDCRYTASSACRKICAMLAPKQQKTMRF